LCTRKNFFDWHDGVAARLLRACRDGKVFLEKIEKIGKKGIDIIFGVGRMGA
jgi:hypothetical protein